MAVWDEVVGQEKVTDQLGAAARDADAYVTAEAEGKGTAALSGGNDHAEGARRIGLRARKPGQRRQGSRAGSELDELAAISHDLASRLPRTSALCRKAPHMHHPRTLAATDLT